MNIPQYVTQLTKDWFRFVSKTRVQGTCVRIDENEDSYTISVDLDALKKLLDLDSVADIADLVDMIGDDLYDEDGNIKFVTTDTTQTITGTKNFENKNLNFSTVTNGLIGTIRPSDTNNGTLVIEAPSKYLRLTASKNNTTLTNAPTATASDTTSKAVATCGWAANLFSAKTHHHDDVYSKLGHTHSGYASTNHTHTGYASSSHTHTEYAEATHTHVAADITDLESTINGKITAWANTEDIAGLKSTVASNDEQLGLVDAALELVEAALYGEGSANGYFDFIDMIGDDLYDDDGNIKFVTTNTEQTITGAKIFRNGTTTANLISLDGSSVVFRRNGTIHGRFRIGSGDNPDFVIEAGNREATTGNQIRLYAAANKTILFNAPNLPASNTTSKAVATCGWAANLFSAKTHNHDDVYSKLGHTHSGYASSTHTHSGYASSTHTHSEYATADQLDTLTVATADLTEVVAGVIQDIEALDVATFEAAIDEYVATKQASVEEEINATGQSILDNLDGYLNTEDFCNSEPLAAQANASAGTATTISRSDHKHPIETPLAASSVVTLGATTGEGTESELTDSYKTPGGEIGKGLKIRVHTRTFYDHTKSSPVLYGYFRTLQFNQFGRLVAATSETRFEIDTPTVVNAT